MKLGIKVFLWAMGICGWFYGMGLIGDIVEAQWGMRGVVAWYMFAGSLSLSIIFPIINYYLDKSAPPPKAEEV